MISVGVQKEIFAGSEAANHPGTRSVSRPAPQAPQCHNQRNAGDATARAAWEAPQLAQRGGAEGMERPAGLPTG